MHFRLESDKSAGRNSLQACRPEKLEDNYKDPVMLPKIEKAQITGTMKAIKEYFRSHLGVKRVPLACIIKKTIVVETHLWHLSMLCNS